MTASNTRRVRQKKGLNIPTLSEPGSLTFHTFQCISGFGSAPPPLECVPDLIFLPNEGGPPLLGKDEGSGKALRTGFYAKPDEAAWFGSRFAITDSITASS